MLELQTVNCATESLHCPTAAAVAAETNQRRRKRVKKFVVVTFLAVAVKPVIVGAAKPRTPGTVVALPGGHQYQILFLARSGCKELSNPEGPTKAGSTRPEIVLQNIFKKPAGGEAGVSDQRLLKNNSKNRIY